MPLKPRSQQLYSTPFQLALDLFLIGAGSALCALGVNGLLVPQHFATGGIAGLSLVIHKIYPLLDLSLIYLLLNIPLFLLAWMVVGRRFFFYSILGAVSFSIALAVIDVPITLNDQILSALLAGLIIGTGAGMVLRSSGSQGGVDILSIMLLKRFSISLGNTVLSVNILVLGLVAFFYSIEAVLYTLIVLYVSARMVNLVVTGLSQRKAVMIISGHWEQISREILKDIRRGVTVLNGKGGYSGQEEHILYAVIPTMEIGRMKKIIRQIDPDAFIVISSTQEVVNHRIGNQPHW